MMQILKNTTLCPVMLARASTLPIALDDNSEENSVNPSLKPQTSISIVNNSLTNLQHKQHISSIVESLFNRKNERMDINKPLIESNPNQETLRKAFALDQYFVDFYSEKLTICHNNNLKVSFKNHRNPIQLSDFQFIKEIGRGGYSTVDLVKKQQVFYAMKKIEKTRINNNADFFRTQIEHRLLKKAAFNKWLVNLFYSFQDKHRVYLVMDYFPGGDFRSLLGKYVCFDESQARFYFAEMLLCVEELHSLGYCHRDLKPENFLIDSHGHLKLSDFGLAAQTIQVDLANPFRCIKPENNANKTSLEKIESTPTKEIPIKRFVPHRFPLSPQIPLKKHRSISSDFQLKKPKLKKKLSKTPEILRQKHPLFNSHSETPGSARIRKSQLESDSSLMYILRNRRVFSMVGSPEYMAPEVIRGWGKGSGYTKSVDFWSLGCILFEMVSGCPPFLAQSPQEIFLMVQNWKDYLEEPTLQDGTPFLSSELWDLISCLLCENNARFTCVQDIFNHSWFKCKFPVPNHEELSLTVNNVYDESTFKEVSIDDWKNCRLSPPFIHLDQVSTPPKPISHPIPKSPPSFFSPNQMGFMNFTYRRSAWCSKRLSGEKNHPTRALENNVATFTPPDSMKYPKTTFFNKYQIPNTHNQMFYGKSIEDSIQKNPRLRKKRKKKTLGDINEFF